MDDRKTSPYLATSQRFVCEFDPTLRKLQVKVLQVQAD